jgi:hypothetical protein
MSRKRKGIASSVNTDRNKFDYVCKFPSSYNFFPMAELGAEPDLLSEIGTTVLVIPFQRYDPFFL